MTSEVLMHATLAMDSYNRGYNQGITDLGQFKVPNRKYNSIISPDISTPKQSPPE
jgi:hypothetical protein